MSTKTKAAESAAEQNVNAAETGETVTVDRAEFEALLADMKLMKQQLTSESRQKELADKKLLEDEEERRRIEEANEKAMEPVEYHVELGNMRGSKNVEVSINGVQYLIPRGQTVMIPRCVAEVLDNAKKQREIAYGLQEQRADEFRKDELSYAG